VAIFKPVFNLERGNAGIANRPDLGKIRRSAIRGASRVSHQMILSA